MKLIRPKYVVVPYTMGNSKIYAYGISKRFLCSFYRKLCHHKIVRYKSGGSSSSYEILTFGTVDEAAFEIAKLVRGEGRIIERYWEDGKCIRTIRR